jgi:hypothetical protein
MDCKGKGAKKMMGDRVDFIFRQFSYQLFFERAGGLMKTTRSKWDKRMCI